MRAFKKISFVFTFLLAVASPATHAAQNKEAGLEEILITGSYIKGTDTSAANPVSVLNREDIAYTGATDITELMNTLSVNSGAENRPDTFTSFYNQGTSNINLRGLGLSSTLVLINGKRQTLSGAKAQDGSVFVDTSSIPAIAIERIEVLKEGAASTYGSDAVAGVVNFITNKDFDGIKIEGKYQTLDKKDQDDKNVSIMTGFGNGSSHVVLAASFLERSSLSSAEKVDLVSRAISSLGTTFRPVSDVTVPSGPWAGTYAANENVPKPNCAETGGVLIPQSSGARCGFFYGPRYNLINEESRQQYYANFSQTFNDNIELNISGQYTNYEILDNFTTPSYPNLDFPTISASHPDNPFGVDVVWFGRPLTDPYPSPKAPRDNDTLRFESNLSGSFNSEWDWFTALSYSQNEYYISQPETFKSRLNLALAGAGGVNGNQYFNPFDPVDNDPELIEWMEANFQSTTETTLAVWDSVINGTLFTTQHGPINVAFGAQYRQESYKVNPSAASTINYDASGAPIATDFIFLGGVNEIDESRNAYAIFAEAEIPLRENLDLNTAIRYEKLDTATSIDPKVAVRYQVSNTLILRASASTSFREPSLSQSHAQTVSLKGIQDYELDANGNFILSNGARIPKGGVLFVRQIVNGTEDLDPEEATNYNLGAVWKTNMFETKLDYWKIDYKDVITIQDPQGNLLEDPDGENILRLDPNTPNSQLTGILTDYFNASTIDASGLDLETTVSFDLNNSALTLKLNASHYLEYVIPVNGEKKDVVGFFNHDNFARSMPATKGGLSARWYNEKHSLYAKVNYISNYKTERITPANVSPNIDAFITMDFQYRYVFDLSNAEIETSLGVLNVFNEQPPEVYDAANFNYDPKHHDPRGRVLYLQASYTF